MSNLGEAVFCADASTCPGILTIASCRRHLLERAVPARTPVRWCRIEGLVATDPGAANEIAINAARVSPVPPHRTSLRTKASANVGDRSSGLEILGAHFQSSRRHLRAYKLVL